MGKGQDQKGRNQGDEKSGRDDPPKEVTKAGLLAHNAAFAKSSADHARDHGFQQTPGLKEIIQGKQSEKAGESLGELLPGARMRPHPDLPETELRPPVFLSPLEAMSDIYMRTRGRMTNRTKQLLESPDLEDLLGMLVTLHTNEELVRSTEGRIKAAIWSELKDDPGPLLLGLNDKRLTEPWRLFLDRWDIWVPDEEEDSGVELFWEGEGEDEVGDAIEILQSLSFRKGELTFYAKMGEIEDRITFDGKTFYRLKTEL